MPKYDHDNFGDVMNHIFAKGVITSVDSENDLADVTVEGYQDGSDIPLFYHCEAESEERSNGAVEGAAAAFSEDDEVIVMCTADGAPVRIVGLVDGIKECGWKEEWGDTLCENHDWAHYDAKGDSHDCPTLPHIWIRSIESNWASSELSLADGVIFMSLWDVRTFRHIWLRSYILEEVPVNTMVIKIATTWPSTPTAGEGNYVRIFDSDGNNATLVFNSDEPITPPSYFIGDNGGAEQILTLTDYGLSGNVSTVRFGINKWEANVASMLIDYLRFR